jgi:predicted nuclease of predicted toxin-antitoxin system
MRFLLDMCVDVRVAEWLRSQGHDVVHLRDQGLQRLANGEIFRKAASENRAVLTFDLGFGEIAALTRSRPASVMIFRLQNARYQHVIERLGAVLAESAAALEKSAVISVEETRHRVRYFPAGTQNDKE